MANDSGMCHSCGGGIGACVKAAEQVGRLGNTQGSHWELVHKMEAVAPMTVSSFHKGYGITESPLPDAATAAAVGDKRRLGQGRKVAPLK